ncbi:MAG: hypothetical protein K8S13_21290 [Desulfobacula sp.]|uniref:hypothetical protein n=1 Tax=Desulfobacula sp. TaxID=2593537 RepID=UPI0025BBB52B|nr:hypothetical protein [Desulfobacula sp.]MCD4722368.1 hypothetical protein [Desulfobacula sp.]
MLTTTSGINYITGYQAQLDVSNTDKSSNSADHSSSNRKESNDTVNISREARELQQEYQGEKNTLEQNYNSETQQLEREFLQEKNRIEREFTQKKQSLEINVYA